MKLSVFMITYNHEAFIAEALDSILMQQVNFDYEVVIGEDCSTDHTREIVVDYQRRYPDKIRPLLYEHNIGMMPNTVQVLRACQGQYVAMLEGDDYWTDPLKLQKQVDFLDTHSEFSMCFHNVLRKYSDGEIGSNGLMKMIDPSLKRRVFTLRDLLRFNFVATCSVVFRANGFVKLPDWFEEMKFGDYTLHLLNALQGDIGYLDEMMAVYRVHSAGMWSGSNDFFKSEGLRTVYDAIEPLVPAQYKDLVHEGQSLYRLRLANLALQEGTIDKARSYVRQALKIFPFFKQKSLVTTADIMTTATKAYTPRIYQLGFAIKHNLVRNV